MPPRKQKAAPAADSREHGNSWALKRADGEPFTRSDIQFDLLLAIFQDQSFQFTSAVDQRAVSFGTLYLEALSKHSKAAKTTIKQLEDYPDWAFSFCVASFLVNIGRINTTVAFYPELRAYMRTYHSIPCLQRDEFSKSNLQDAPRIKTMLKSCSLPTEGGKSIETLPAITKRSTDGFRPPTSVVNMIFEIFSVEAFVTKKYFPEGFGLYDLFTDGEIPSKLRAYAFLWLMHHFLEDPVAVSDFETDAPVTAFGLHRGQEEVMDDLAEEVAWGKEMQTFRLEFLKKWKGQEGLAQSESPAEPASTPLTKRQKIIAANYATALEAEESSAQKPQKRPRLTGGDSAVMIECTPLEGLQLSADSIINLHAEPSELVGDDRKSLIALQFARVRRREENNIDPVLDSDDEGDGPTTVIELKSRLFGFKFARPDGKDLLVRYGPRGSASPPTKEEDFATFYL